MSHFPLLRSFQRVRPNSSPYVIFHNKFVFYGELLAVRPIPKLEGHPLQTLRAYLYNISYSRLPSIFGGCLLRPQHEDAPCRGDRDPFNMEHHCYTLCKSTAVNCFSGDSTVIRTWLVQFMLCDLQLSRQLTAMKSSLAIRHVTVALRVKSFADCLCFIIR
jgi:hypothetical protein